MDLELSSLETSVKAELQPRVRKYRSDLDNLVKQFENLAPDKYFHEIIVRYFLYFRSYYKLNRTIATTEEVNSLQEIQITFRETLITN